MSCNSCKATLLLKDKLKCSTCPALFHYYCVGFTVNTFKKTSQNVKTFKCSVCLNNNQSDESEVSPISRSDEPYSSPPTGSQVCLDPAVLTMIGQQISLILNNSISPDIKAIRQELSGIQEIKNKMDILQTMYDKQEKKLEEAVQEISTLKSENLTLRQNQTNLNSRLSILEREIRASNLEIHCIPENRSENLISIIKQIGRTIGDSVDDSNILKCTRIAKMNRDNSRPRTVLVKFASSLSRDNFFAKVINFNKANQSDKLNTSHLGIGGEKKPIYVCDHLTPEAKSLHAAVRRFAKENSYKFVWSRYNNIYLRKTPHSDVKLIKNLEYLKELI